MRLERVRVEGFRLLHDIEILLEAATTVIVGRNNSGKTSLTDVFDRFTSGRTSFRLQDFSAENRQGFIAAKAARDAKASAKDVLALLPKIAITLTFSYDKAAADLGPLSPFIIDLDTTSNIVIARLEYVASLATLGSLLDLPNGDAGANGEGPGATVDAIPVLLQDVKPGTAADLFRHIREMLASAYAVEVWAIDPTRPSNQRKLDEAKFNALVQCNIVRAQRTLDHASHGDADVIGKILSTLYRTAKAPTSATMDQALAAQLKQSVESIERDVQGNFNDLIEGLLPAMDMLGFPGPIDARLRPETTLNVEALLNDHTKVVYASADGVHLPEGYNGLGTRNLIYMLLQLQTYHKEYRARATRPMTHLIFIEEPEAHLHPQMQEVFIAQLQAAVAELSKTYPSEPAWKVQFVITTHSPHVANAATFEAVRYFLNDTPGDGIRRTKVKDFKKGAAAIADDDKEFLHQYMTLTKCDLYFADKAIMVEGATERILMPRLREIVDRGLDASNKLARQYVTTIEVGGAYAHLFYPLIDFLELKTLVITDLDAVKPVEKLDKNGKPITTHEKCLVAEGKRTTNTAIRHFFKTDETAKLPDLDPSDLIKKSDTEKTRGVRRIAYQIPEQKDGKACARSFEDALILANPVSFGLTLEADAEQAWASAEALAKSESKADIALRFAIKEKSWTAPRYIREGLAWLSEPPPPPAEPPPVVAEDDEVPEEAI